MIEYKTKDFSERLSRIIISKIDYINRYIWHEEFEKTSSLSNEDTYNQSIFLARKF